MKFSALSLVNSVKKSLFKRNVNHMTRLVTFYSLSNRQELVLYLERPRDTPSILAIFTYPSSNEIIYLCVV